jgi:hypothetical protein
MQKRRTRTVAQLTAAVVTALTAVTLAGVINAPAAQAEAGYRLCPYVKNQGGWTEGTSKKSFHAYVAVKIKKDEGCPTVKAENWRWIGRNDDPQPKQQPVSPIPCEDFKKDWWPSSNYPDICKVMTLAAPTVFEFRVYDDGSGTDIWTGQL